MTLGGVTGTIPVWPSVSLWLSLLFKWQRSGGRANASFKRKRDPEKCVIVWFGSGFEWKRIRMSCGWFVEIRTFSPFYNFIFFCLTLWAAWHRKVDSLIHVALLFTKKSFVSWLFIFSFMTELWGTLWTVAEAQREKDGGRKTEGV